MFPYERFYGFLKSLVHNRLFPEGAIIHGYETTEVVGGPWAIWTCRCLNLSTSMGGTRSKVEGGDRHDLEPEGTREDTRHEIYTGSGSRSSYPTSCLE
jgi:hypothetical protein